MKRKEYSQPVVEVLEIHNEGCLASSLTTGNGGRYSDPGLTELLEEDYDGFDW